VKGLDTNVLVRYLTQDNVAQARAVDSLVAEALSEGERLHVDDVVLCELVWVLRGAYRAGKPAIVSALQKISSTALFNFEDREVLRRAVDDYRDGGGDFADYLIGRRNRRAGCEGTVTFDRALKGAPAFSVL
jgi:predicted nucleic-acid-binding protein